MINKYDEKNNHNGDNKLLGEARKLIAQSKVSAAIKLLLTYTESQQKEDLNNQLVQQSEKWNKLKKEERMGIIGYVEANLRNNQIVNGLLMIVGELKKE